MNRRRTRFLAALGMTIGRRRDILWLSLLVLLILLSQAPAPAEAHANLVESNPAANSVLPDTPDGVTIRFSEPLEPALSEIRVLNSQGRRVDNTDSKVDPDNAHLMSVSVEPLTNGTYTVAWKNVSTVDGHLIRGAFVFSVGEPVSSEAPDTGLHQPLLHSPLQPVARWIILLGILSAVGGVTFLIFVARPALTDQDTQYESIAVLRRMVFWGVLIMACMASAVLIVASVVQLVVQASVAYETSIMGALGEPLRSLLVETDWGRLWLWRALLAALMMVVLGTAWLRLRTEDESRGVLFLMYSAALLGLGVLLTISMTSHAAATPNVRGMALLNDLVHMVGAAVWVGGLISLATTLFLSFKLLENSERRPILTSLARRFSLVAGLSVAVLVLTGIYSAWAQVTVVQALSTPYGRTLVIKIGLVALMLLAAAANLVWVRPRLGSDGRAAYWLRRLVVVECVLGVLVILSVGFLTVIEPARQVASRSGIAVGDQRLTFQESDEGADMTLSIIPGQVGPNRIEVSVRDRFGEPIANATDVRVRLSYLDADLGETPLSATHLGAGEYLLDGQQMGLAGAWQSELVVQRLDAFDARAAFRFEVSGGGGSLAIAPTTDTGRTLLGIELGVLGLILLGIGLPMGGWYSRKGRLTMAPGVLGVLVGGALVFNSLGSDTDSLARNPIPPSSESIGAGQALYQTHCLLCHGETGLGDGPSAATMNPPPADLVVHVPLHPDRALFDFVRDGIPGTAMPALGDTLSDDEIWHIINYIQTLE